MTETVSSAVAKKSERPVKPTIADDGVLALAPDQTWWSARQVAALKALGLEKASEPDLLVFLNYCQRTGLDPFAKQIYMIERKSKVDNQWVIRWVIQVGIDGFRVNAQRAADKRQMVLEYEDTIWYDKRGGKHEVWLGGEDGKELPAAAKVTIVKVMANGTRLKVPAIAKFDSYAAWKDGRDGSRYLQSQWGVMPDHMIEKCAEAFALRRCFPQDLGGLYIEEELQNNPPPEMPYRQYEPTPEDDGVVPSEVVADGPESNGEQSAAEPAASPEPTREYPENPADAPEADTPKVPLKAESSAKLMAIFREYKLGTKDQAQIRRAVVTGLLDYDAKRPTTHFLDPAKMTSAEMAHVVQLLDSWTNQFNDGTQGDATMAIIKFADGVIKAVEVAQA